MELLLPVRKFRNSYVTASCTTQVVPSYAHIIGYILRKRRAYQSAKVPRNFLQGRPHARRPRGNCRYKVRFHPFLDCEFVAADRFCDSSISPPENREFLRQVSGDGFRTTSFVKNAGHLVRLPITNLRRPVFLSTSLTGRVSEPDGCGRCHFEGIGRFAGYPVEVVMYLNNNNCDTSTVAR